MNFINYNKLKVVNYNRKSTESEERQMLSIDSQIDETRKLAKQLDISILETLEESKSGKMPDKRPIFSQMIKDIKKGKYDAIMCWKLDRLARNMIEGGIIMDMLQRGIIKCIITPSKIYDSSENTLLLSVEFGSANQFVRDLSVNVKRGQTKKASMGYPHGVASLGFINDKTEEKGNRKWRVDPSRLDKVKKLLNRFLEGGYSAGKLYDYAINDLGLTTVSRKKIGGNFIQRSRIYEILKDPIYAGFFFYGGERYELHKSLPRLISENDHNKILQLLGDRSIPRIKNHKTLYSQIIKSPHGYFLGQDVKSQVICDCKRKFSCIVSSVCPNCHTDISEMSSPKLLGYTYHYDCRKKKAKQSYTGITEENITKQLIEHFEKTDFVLSPDLIQWSRDHIHELKDHQIEENLLSEKNIEEDTKIFEDKKFRIREMYRNGDMTQEEYKEDLRRVHEKYQHLSKTKPESDQSWMEHLNEIINFSESVIEILKNGNFESKRHTLLAMGSNLVWNEENLCIYWSKPVQALMDGIKGMKEKYPWFEPKKYVVNKGENEKTPSENEIFSTMLRLVYDIGTSLWNNPENRYIIPKIISHSDGSYNCYIPMDSKTIN